MTISQTNVKMSLISQEKQSTALPAAAQNISLRGLSVDGINDFQYVGGAYTDIAGSPNQSSPYGLGEFRGYTHTIESAVAINGTNRYWGKGSRQRIGYTSGNDSYIGDAQGSISSGSPLSSSDGWGLSMSVQVAAWIEKANGVHHFAFEATTSSATGANLTWWNKVTISRSGQTDVVLTRANTSKNEHSNYRMNIWWNESTANYIGNGLATWTFSNS